MTPSITACAHHHERMQRPHVEYSPVSGGQGQPILRFVLAALVTSVAALLATGLLVFGQAQYVQDYCHTRVEPPATFPPEALSGRPAYWDNPVTVACEFDGFPTIYTTDPGPVVGGLILLGVVLVVTLVAFDWARAGKRKTAA